MGHILVVDDEAICALALASVLRRRDWRVTVAHNGIQALEAFGQDPADVVVTDMRMPCMGGLELIGALRARDPLLPVIVVSGFSPDMEQLPTANLIVLSKPVDPFVVVRAAAAFVPALAPPKRVVTAMSTDDGLGGPAPLS